MSFSDFLELALLNHVFGATTYPAPGTLYVGLSSTLATDAGNITEPVGGQYARVAVVNNPTNWPAASAGAKSNGTAITFNVANADWASGQNLLSVVVYDAPTVGNVLGWGALTTPKPVLNGDTASFAPTTLTITLD